MYVYMDEKKKSPDRYLKRVVIYCIAFISLYTIAQICLSYFLKFELSPTLTTCVYAFFGTELCIAALIRILDREDKVQQRTVDIKTKDSVVTPDIESVG